MKKMITALAVVALAAAAPAAAQDFKLSFFITSAGPGDGADLGGLRGADQHCTDLAYAQGFGDLLRRVDATVDANSVDFGVEVVG